MRSDKVPADEGLQSLYKRARSWASSDLINRQPSSHQKHSQTPTQLKTDINSLVKLLRVFLHTPTALNMLFASLLLAGLAAASPYPNLKRNSWSGEGIATFNNYSVSAAQPSLNCGTNTSRK